MYVKVTNGLGPNGLTGDFLCEVQSPLHSGYISSELGENAKWEPDEQGGKLIDPDIDFSGAIGASIQFLHMLEFNPEQTKYEKNKNMVAFRFAWWEDPKDGLTAVITTRNIFILGANGKTIDRV